MAAVRVLVETRKGAFVMTSDERPAGAGPLIVVGAMAGG